jgi:hypothetical protein
MGKHFIGPKSIEILSIFQVFPCTTQIALFWPKLLPAKFFLVRRKLPFFGQNCSLPFSLRSLDIPALLKSWQKH